MSRAYIALGSNIGNRAFFIDSAVKRINRERGITVKRRSSIYETLPVGGSNQPRYLNGVLKIDTVLNPHKLLSRLMRIEKSLGRRRTEKNSPRTIDLDILLYDDIILNSDELVLPHPRMHKRDFVLFGMREIAPEAMHPVLKKSIRDIYNRKRPMKIIKSPKEMYCYLSSLKTRGKTIGFVPTMGYLHDGHLSLIKKARQENDVVVISIFVNTLQFGPREDYRSYPRDFKRDKALAKNAGVDVIFNPDVRDMYTRNHSTFVNVEKISENLCGRFRPRHFKGVATVVMKLFNIVPADTAYFGQKDAQQAFVIMRMAKDLNIAVKIKMLPIVREKDGLAMSSRNIYLDSNQRQEAPALHKSLCAAKKMIKKGERDSKKIIRKMNDLIHKESSAKIQYISIVDTKELKDVEKIKGRVLIALAAYFGKTRLIDNVIVSAT